jgi:hypothetical protein
MPRSTAAFAITCCLFAPLPAYAHQPNRDPKPTVCLRSTGQFVTQTAEKEATLYDLQGQAIRVFVSPSRIFRIELSADEKLILVEGVAPTVFDVQTGAAVTGASFVPVAEPTGQRYRCEVVESPYDWHVWHLELIDNTSGQRVRRPGTYDRYYEMRWLATGEAELPVMRNEKGQEGVALLRFNPSTGTVKELLWFPVFGQGSFLFIEGMAFDPERQIGVKTSYRFVTEVFDLRTGQRLLSIDNSKNYYNPYADYWSTPVGYLSSVELLLMTAVALFLLVGLCLALRMAWRLTRRIPLGGPAKQDADDYGEHSRT